MALGDPRTLGYCQRFALSALVVRALHSPSLVLWVGAFRQLRSNSSSDCNSQETT